MGAGHGAAVALRADFSIPVGNLDGYAALAVFRRAERPCAIEAIMLLEYRYRNKVALLTIHRFHDILNEFRQVGQILRRIDSIGPRSRNFYFYEAFDTSVNCFVVLVDDFLTAFFEVAVIVALLHRFHSHVDRNNLGQFEERSLENRVDTFAQADFTS